MNILYAVIAEPPLFCGSTHCTKTLLLTFEVITFVGGLAV